MFTPTYIAIWLVDVYISQFVTKLQCCFLFTNVLINKALENINRVYCMQLSGPLPPLLSLCPWEKWKIKHSEQHLTNQLMISLCRRCFYEMAVWHNRIKPLPVAHEFQATIITFMMENDRKQTTIFRNWFINSIREF